MTRTHKLIAAMAFIVAALIVYKVILASLLTDEDRIRREINIIVDSAEERNLHKISGYLHADFTAEEVNFDRQATIDALRQVFLMYNVIRVRVSSLSVKLIDDTTAEATFVAAVRAAHNADSSEDDLLRYRGSERFKVTFKKVKNDWLIIRSAVVKSTAD